MLIGVPKEIKNHEYRVGLVPSSVRELVANGHQVLVQQNAGAGIGIEDHAYEQAGAKVVETAPEIYQGADMIVKVKEPQPEECRMLRENKLLLVSIGYAACHWCHVMAHESFEDEATAKLMNELFVNIKVDREERPDLDKVFQTAHYILTHQPGGWPLTIFLTPDDLAPFFSGTYFPLDARYQLPAFKDVLRTLAEIYKHHPQEIKHQNQQLITILQYHHPAEKDIKLSAQPLQLANQVLQEKFDTQYGGFSDAPKFPHPTIIEYLLHEKSTMAFKSLLHMAEGGIYDQLQGGFFRYSVDEKWQIPHFEKMLYDNGQLLFLYALASQVFNEPYFAEVARETAEWVISKMQSPEGGYYSSLDADSEGKEGKFYVWDKPEIEKLLTEMEANVAEIYFGFSEPPNFEKHWHLHVANSLEKIAEQLKISIDEAKNLLASAKQKLLDARKQRVVPSQDQKILTAWNALMIKGMATAGDILQEPRYITSALDALKFIQEKLWVNNRLLVSYKDEKANIPAFLDDYAYLLDAVITVLQISWKKKNLEFAIKLADNLLTHFVDKENGGFFFTADDHEKILYRPKTMADEAIPAGNGVAAQALLTLGHLLSETRYIDAVETTLKSAWPALSKFPAEHCSLLTALKNFLMPQNLIVIRGEESESKLWQNFAKDKNRLQNEIFAIPVQESNLPGILASRKSEGKICAYVCQGTKCLPLITEFDQFKNSIK